MVEGMNQRLVVAGVRIALDFDCRQFVPGKRTMPDQIDPALLVTPILLYIVDAHGAAPDGQEAGEDQGAQIGEQPLAIEFKR
jgi:hypothetical protein